MEVCGMFKQLGNIITKWPLAFIAIWAIILIISAGLATNLGSHLLYDTSSFTSNSSESKQADNLLNAVFPDTAKSQLIVAVSADNETARRAFITQLNSTVMADPSIYNVTNTTSIYNVQSTILEKMTPDIYSDLFEAMDNVSNGSQQLYNATDEVINTSNSLYWLYDNVTTTNSQFYQARKQILSSSSRLYSARDQIVQANSGLYQIKGSIDVLLGMPAYFAQVYANASSNGLDNTNSTIMAIGETDAFVSGNVPSADQQMAYGYLQAFDTAWNATSISNPFVRAQQAITSAGPGFIDSAIPSGEQPLMLNIVDNFPLSSYPGGERDFCVNAVATSENITSATEKQQLYAAYDLGQSPSDAAIESLVVSAAASESGMDTGSIEAIYGLGRNPSDGTIGNYLVNQAIISLENSDSGKNMSVSDLKNATDMIHEAWNIGGTATEQDFNSYVLQTADKGLNASENQTLAEIYGWGPDPNATVVRDYVLQQAGNGENASENQTLAEIYDMGRDPSNATIDSYVIQQAADDLNITGNLSYFYMLMGSGRDLSDDQLNVLADSWADTHSFNDPQLLPESVTSMIESGNETLYIIALSAEGSNESAKLSYAALEDDVENLLGQSQYNGIVAHVTGTPAIEQDMTTAAMKDVSSIDEITIPMVILIMAVYFLSVVAPFVPLGAIGVAVVTGMGALYLATFVVGDVYNMAQTFLIVTMLGAGIDYCVFILSRYSEERNMGGDVKESVRYAVEHAGKSIACSAIVAAIGFGSLTLIDHGIFMSIGVSVAIGIFVAMCSALTLIPAIITLIGDRAFWPRKVNKPGQQKSRLGPRIRGVTKFSLKHWKAVLMVLFVVLLPLTYIALQLNLSQDTLSMLPSNSESKIGYDMIENVFGSGNIDKTSIIVTLPEDIKDNGNYSVQALDQVEAISKIAAAEPGVSEVYSMTRPYGSTIQYDNLSVYNALEQDLYTAYMDNNTGSDDRTTVVYVAFNGSPYSAQALNTITDLRSKMQEYSSGTGSGTSILVGGSAASLQDYENSCTPRYPLVIITVFAGIFLILLFLLRSGTTPPRMFLAMISMIALTLGVFTLLFQDLMQAAIFWVLPVCLFCILIGLGGDYVIFMMSRVREEVNKGKSDEDAILDAVESTGPVIMLCGFVMATAFASMMASSMIMMKEFGFVLSFGIILDATVMIWLIIPALMMAFKKYNWWFPGNKKAPEIAVAAQGTEKQ
jgi:RND superfamily putative drug exporter